MPELTDSLSKSVEWSMMSKAADKSSFVRMVILPLSIYLRMSFVIRKRELSVLCFSLYAD